MAAHGRLSRNLVSVAAALLTALVSAGCGAGSDETPTTYDVTVSVTTATDLNSLHFTLFSFFNDGDFIGHGDDLDCTALVNATFTSTHFGDGSLEIQMQANTDSFPVPGPVMRCGLRTSEIMRDTSLDIEFHDATDFTFGPTAAGVVISSVVIRP